MTVKNTKNTSGAGRLLRPAAALVAAAGLGAALTVGGAGAAGAAPLGEVFPELADIPGVGDIDIPGLEGVTTPEFFGPEQLGAPNFATPSITPSESAVVGVAQPIIVNFPAPVEDRAVAEKAMRVTTDADVEGDWHWFGDSQARWRPADLWPANTHVTVEAGDAVREFTVGDAFVATADEATKTVTVTRNGEVVRTMPMSMGKPGYVTPNGVYTVGEMNREMVMDSSTYGVPISDPEGYRLDVEYAVRMSNSGLFLHAAPWSTWAQGSQNVSHGCINVSTEDARWYFENATPGDAIVVVNSQGQMNGHDGLTDFSMSWDEWTQG